MNITKTETIKTTKGYRRRNGKPAGYGPKTQFTIEVDGPDMILGPETWTVEENGETVSDEAIESLRRDVELWVRSRLPKVLAGEVKSY